jgi:hypothetical protein
MKKPTAASIVSMGRRLGKSTWLQAYTQHITGDVYWDDTLAEIEKYSITKTWNDRRGRKMLRINATREVRVWLKTDCSQFGVSDPLWWEFDGLINIRDTLYTVLVMRWA